MAQDVHIRLRFPPHRRQILRENNLWRKPGNVRKRHMPKNILRTHRRLQRAPTQRKQLHRLTQRERLPKFPLKIVKRQRHLGRDTHIVGKHGTQVTIRMHCRPFRRKHRQLDRKVQISASRRSLPWQRGRIHGRSYNVILQRRHNGIHPTRHVCHTPQKRHSIGLRF